DTYETADGGFVAVGAIEERFWRDLVTVLGLDPDELPTHVDVNEWPRLREILTTEISRYTRDELVQRAEGTDACLTPVLRPDEAPEHPHNVARGTFVEVDGVPEPAPGPKFDRTPAPEPSSAPGKGADTVEVLAEFGYD